MSQCLSSESEASYYYDKHHYERNDTSKYKYDNEPINPNEYTKPDVGGLKENDKVKLTPSQMEYSVPFCTLDKPLNANNQCYPIESKDDIMDNNCNMTTPYILDGACVDYDKAIESVANKCTTEKPYKYLSTCYETTDELYNDNTEYIFGSKVGDVCYLKDIDIGVSCEDIFPVGGFDVSMLYNPITNNFAGQLKSGDYSYIECTGTTTQCLNEFPYETNEQGELIMKYTEQSKRAKIPVYEPPPNYTEPAMSKYINPYNSDIQSDPFIKCVHTYSDTPKIHMCPKEMPVCEGHLADTQFGVCKESNASIQNVLPHNIHSISCKNNYSSTIANEDMCPYNFPQCENNICKENSLFYNR